QNTAKDKTVPGKSFVHSFTISNITDAPFMTGEGEFNFTLNIKGIDTELFPSDFLIEFYNKITNENTLPYTYTEYVNIAKSESVTLTLTPDKNNLISDNNSLYRCNPSFYIATDYSFSDSDKAKIASAVRIIKMIPEVSASFPNNPLSLQANNSPIIQEGASIDVNSSSLQVEVLRNVATEATQIDYVTDGVTKIWNDNILKVSLAQKLDSNTSYKILLSEIDDIKGITIVPFEEFTFKTVEDVLLSINPSEDSIINTATPTYCLEPTFYITANCDWLTSNDLNLIANSISISNKGNEIAQKTILNNSIVLTFKQKLATETEYLISMDEVKSLDGINTVPFHVFKFTTMSNRIINASFTIVSDETNVLTNSESLYKLNPKFRITSDYKNFNDSDKEKISESILVSNGGSDIASLTWNDNILNLSFGKNLATDTEYEISMGDLSKLEGFSIATFSPITFKTMGSIVFTVTPDEDNIYVAMTPKYQCLPGFTITPNYQLTDDNKAIIADAISVSNSDNTTKTWEGNELKIGFSSNLAPDTSYTLAMSDVNSITGVTVTPFNSVDFTTLATLTFALTPEASNIFVAGPPEL
ncbi:MAG: hypothetical protein IKP71_02290, partial [Candidatus Riflebacteria bacterium]|nr:hypothetical protein [Candidatus Riflebacteria bacterium]